MTLGIRRSRLQDQARHCTEPKIRCRRLPHKFDQLRFARRGTRRRDHPRLDIDVRSIVLPGATTPPALRIYSSSSRTRSCSAAGCNDTVHDQNVPPRVEIEFPRRGRLPSQNPESSRMLIRFEVGRAWVRLGQLASVSSASYSLPEGFPRPGYAPSERRQLIRFLA